MEKKRRTFAAKKDKNNANKILAVIGTIVGLILIFFIAFLISLQIFNNKMTSNNGAQVPDDYIAVPDVSGNPTPTPVSGLPEKDEDDDSGSVEKPSETSKPTTKPSSKPSASPSASTAKPSSTSKPSQTATPTEKPMATPGNQPVKTPSGTPKATPTVKPEKTPQDKPSNPSSAPQVPVQTPNPDITSENGL